MRGSEKYNTWMVPHQSKSIHNQLRLHLPTRCFVDMYFVTVPTRNRMAYETAGNHPGCFKIPCAVFFNDLIPGYFCQEPIIEAPRVKKVVEKGCFPCLMHDAKNLS
ncbi:hypothetical protein OCU04_002473 [Sclerotinia nivalis]|uniref:Uncharacterized protein n=1 Tax=Sclerotinia nivalis TaxID=352851 RepID=A0A9X0DP36_9HELO|nr:hypothetical protein OCU04_002473 [Sclerotinia nivalis]